MKKKIILFFLITFFAAIVKVNAQDVKEEAAKSILHTSDDLKSGNYTDVLTNFFQLAVSDLTSDDRAINFKSTLFAVKAKANPDLRIDTNYLKQYFARNLQFNFSLGLDQDYHLKNYSAGITYALINKRDETVANFMNTEVSALVQEYGRVLHDRITAYLATFDSSSVRRRVHSEIEKGIKFLNRTGSTDSLPQPFLDFANIDFNFFHTEIHRKLDSAYSEVDKKPLLTISGNATSDSSSAKFGSGNLELVFLQGSSPEADLRANLSVKDTSFADEEWRVNFNFKGACNFVLSQEKLTHKSVLEVKLQAEYNHVFRGLFPGEDQDQVMANAEVRVRVTDKLWIPLTIKYDILNPNWYGFLNIAFNLSAL